MAHIEKIHSRDPGLAAAPLSDRATEALHQLAKATQPVRLSVFISITVLSALLAVIGLRYDDPLYGSALLVVDLDLFLMWSVTQGFPGVLARLWARDNISSRGKRSAADVEEKNFVDFLRATANGCQRRVQLVPGTILALVPFWWRWVYCRDRLHPSYLVVKPYSEIPGLGSASQTVVSMVGLVGECAIAFAVGIFLWRLCVVAWGIRTLGKSVEVRPQPLHPDGCAGFRSLGDLCLSIALVVAIPGLFLTAWLLLMKTPLMQTRYGSYQSMYAVLLIFPISLALIAFLLPVWALHRRLKEEGDVFRGRIDAQVRKLDERLETLLAQGLDGAIEHVERDGKQVELLRNLCTSLGQLEPRIPAWPFSLRAQVKFVLAQAPQLVGLLAFEKPTQEFFKSVLVSLKELL